MLNFHQTWDPTDFWMSGRRLARVPISWSMVDPTCGGLYFRIAAASKIPALNPQASSLTLKAEIFASFTSKLPSSIDFTISSCSFSTLLIFCIVVYYSLHCYRVPKHGFKLAWVLYDPKCRMLIAALWSASISIPQVVHRKRSSFLDFRSTTPQELQVCEV
jgi:hypothetical protein